MITIISVGKKHESWITAGLERYEKRLKRPWDVKWVLLPHAATEGRAARQDESERILERLDASDYVVVLDETGQMLDSPGLSALLGRAFTQSRRIVLVIGGAYGVDARLMARADAIWSLSKLVFPHQLVRLLLVEQLYRAQEIDRGSHYHHQ